MGSSTEAGVAALTSFVCQSYQGNQTILGGMSTLMFPQGFPEVPPLEKFGRKKSLCSIDRPANSFRKLRLGDLNVQVFGDHACRAVGRRTEQAKANLDPRVGPRVAVPRVGPRVAPRVRPREPPREHPRGLISLFQPFKDSPRKHPTKVSTEGPTSGRSGFTCPVFTCSDLISRV